jgi:hypothetical protein
MEWYSCYVGEASLKFKAMCEESNDKIACFFDNSVTKQCTLTNNILVACFWETDAKHK